jgi:hypothetical protein
MMTGALRFAVACGALSLVLAASARGQVFLTTDTLIDNDRGGTGFVLGYANQQDFNAKKNGVSVTLTLTPTAIIHSAGAFNGSRINSSGTLQSPAGGLGAHDSAVINIDAGFVYFVDAFDNGSIFMSGGRTNFARFHGSSTGSIGNATIGNPNTPNSNTFLEARENSTVTLDQSRIVDQLRAINSGRINAKNVTVGLDVIASNASGIDLTGGSIGRDLVGKDSSGMSGTGVSIAGLVAADGATMTLSGSTVAHSVRNNNIATLTLTNVVIGDDLMANGPASVTGGIVNRNVIKGGTRDLTMQGTQVVGDVTATSGATVGLNGVTVGGNVTVWSGSITDTQIEGNLGNTGSLSSGVITFIGGKVKGDARMDGRGEFRLVSGQVAGNAAMGFDTALFMMGGSVAGNVSTGNFGTISGGTVAGNVGMSQGFLEIKGGRIERDVAAVNGSVLFLSAGAVAGNIQFSDSARLTVTGGSVEKDVNLSSGAEATLNGGVVSGNLNAPAGTGPVSFDGGIVNGNLVLGNQSTATMKSGKIGGSVGVSGFKGTYFSMAGGTVQANVAVSGGAEFFMDGGAIGGDVSFGDGTDVDINAGTIGGSVRAGGVGISGVTANIGKDLSVTDFRTVVVGTADIGGNVVTTGEGNALLLAPDSFHVAGNLDASMSSLIRAQRTTVGGKVLARDADSRISLEGSTVQGDVITSGGLILSDLTSRILGNVQASGSGGVQLGGGVSGNVSLNDSTLALRFGHVSGNVIGSALSIIKVEEHCFIHGDLVANDTTRVEMVRAGVELGGDLVADDRSHVELAAGDTMVSGNLFGLQASEIFMGAGRIRGSALISKTATLHWFGGTIAGQTPGMASGSGLLGFDDGDVAAAPPPDAMAIALSADDAGTIKIYGTGLEAVLIDPSYQDLYSLYRLTGTLADGSLIDGTHFAIENGTGASYELLPPSAIPEPGTVALLVALGVTLPLRRSHGRSAS